MKRDELVKRMALAVSMNDTVRIKIFEETHLEHLSEQEKVSIKAEVMKQVDAIKAEAAKVAKAESPAGPSLALKVDDLTLNLKPK